jgi:methionine sulfoxide reductase heme-binding subunit
MNAYVIAIATVIFVMLIAAFSAHAIQFQGGANPADKKKRKLWFWILSVLAPILTYVVGAFIIYPDPEMNPIPYDEHMNALPIASVVAIVLYILIGLVLSKMKVSIKIAHWFN